MAAQRPYHPVAGDEPPRYQHVVGVPRAQPESSDAVGSLAELPSPVDGREPSLPPAALQSDYSKEDRVSGLPNTTAHPADRPNPAYF